jgi:predicted RNase H-like HicB family nuclease
LGDRLSEARPLVLDFFRCVAQFLMLSWGEPARATVQAMSDSLELTVRYEDAGDGWVTAQVLEVPGAISEGRGRHEARANVIDALQTVLTPDEQLAGEAPGDRESLILTVGG